MKNENEDDLLFVKYIKHNIENIIAEELFYKHL